MENVPPMPVTYRIHPDLGLAFVRYTGFALLDDSFAAVGRYLQDPLFAPDQKQFVDLSGVTGFETDYARLFALQAKKAEALMSGSETLIVYFAPTETTLSMASLIARSWDDVEAVVPVVVSTLEEACTVLGLELAVVSALLEHKEEPRRAPD